MDALTPTDSGLRAAFLRERAMLLRLLTARLGGIHEAEDVLQDAWLKLDGSFMPGPIADASAFLFRMVHNVALDRRRTAISQSARDARWLEVQPAAAERPDAEAVLLGQERLRHVEAALAALPERAEQAFRRFRLDGIPQRQIAAEMGLSLSAVEKLLQRAYRQIHDSGREQNAGHPPRQRLEGEEQPQ